MKAVLRDKRAVRMLAANFLGWSGNGISLIAIPWLVIAAPGGERLFGIVTVLTTLGSLALLPLFASIVDRCSRRSILLWAHGAGAGFVLSMAAVGLVAGFPPWTLAAVYVSAMLFASVHYPTLFAFNQEVFEPSLYGELAGAFEVQGQAASILAAGLGMALIGHVGVEWILLLNAVCYGGAAWILATIPYTPQPRSAAARAGIGPALTEGWHYLRDHARLGLFLGASLLPFVAIMVGNYIWPVYLQRVLHEGPRAFAAGEVLFAVGAITAGFLTPGIVRRQGSGSVVLIALIALTLTFAAQAAVHVTWIYLATMVLVGIGNATSRVARSTLLLRVVPNQVIGRVNTFFNIVQLVLRATLLAAATGVITTAGAGVALWMLAALAAVALALCQFTRSAAPRPPSPGYAP